MAVPTAIIPMLSVHDTAGAIEFYKRAFEATEILRHTTPDGAIIAELAIDGVKLMVTDAAPELGNPSPTAVHGTTVRLELVVADPDAVAQRAVDAGAREMFPIEDREYGWRQGRVVDPFGHHWLIGRPL
jgi:PhnB protein